MCNLVNENAFVRRHFTINLPGDKPVYVRWVTMRKKLRFSNLLNSRKSNRNVEKSYIVKVAPAANEHQE